MNEMEPNPDISAGVAAIKTLFHVIQNSKCKPVPQLTPNSPSKSPISSAVDTIQELNNTIQSAVQSMRKTEQPITAVVSACELFSRFITLARFDDKTMDECKAILVNRGEIFLNKLMQARPIIAKLAAQFITDDCVSVPHSATVHPF